MDCATGNRLRAILGCSLSLILALPLFAEDKLALVGGMLLDGYDVPPLHHAAILIADGRIAAIERADELEIPSNTRIVDTRGRVMIPGLIDLHAHLAVLGHGEYGRWFEWVKEQDLDIE